MNVRKVAEDATTVTIALDPPAGAEAYELVVDGSPVLKDGHRHFFYDATVDRKLGKVADGNPHTYGVRALSKADEGAITLPEPPAPPPAPGPAWQPAPPQGTLVDKTTAQWFRDGTHPATIKGLHIHDVGDYGLAIMGTFTSTSDPKPAVAPFAISDVISERIGHYPTVSDGRAEAGIWIGYQANVERVIGHGTWECLWTGSACRNSVISDFLLAKRAADGTFSAPAEGIGIYPEHATIGTTFQRGDIHPSGNGINSEWWYADQKAWTAYLADLLGSSFAGAGKAGSCNNRFTNLRIYCAAGHSGIFLDAGTFGCKIDHVEFWGPGDAVTLPNRRLGPDNVVDVASCVFNNGGKKVSYHDNAIGVAGPRLVQPARRLHPHTVRRGGPRCFGGVRGGLEAVREMDLHRAA